jgi:hypothetical protein
MPHFKCVACRTRLHRAAGPAGLVGDLCPGCGSLLEPVSELAELVGFRRIQRRRSPAQASSGGLQRLADRVGEIRTRREAHETQAPFDASRWLDDGGSFSPEAVADAVAPAKPQPPTTRLESAK